MGASSPLLDVYQTDVAAAFAADVAADVAADAADVADVAAVERSDLGLAPLSWWKFAASWSDVSIQQYWSCLHSERLC